MFDTVPAFSRIRFWSSLTWHPGIRCIPTDKYRHHLLSLSLIFQFNETAEMTFKAKIEYRYWLWRKALLFLLPRIEFGRWFTYSNQCSKRVTVPISEDNITASFIFAALNLDNALIWSCTFTITRKTLSFFLLPRRVWTMIYIFESMQ
jgi:hypothetical protein